MVRCMRSSLHTGCLLQLSCTYTPTQLPVTPRLAGDMAELSETWQPRQLLQSFCSQAAGVTVLRLTRPVAAAAAAAEGSAAAAAATAAAGQQLDVLLSLYSDSLCCALLPASARAAAAADAAAAAAAAAAATAAGTSPGAAAAAAADAAEGPLPSYLETQFWGPLQLSDAAVEDAVSAFAACTLTQESSSSSSSSSSSCSVGLVLSCGASGLMRLMLLTLKPELQHEQQQQQQQQQQDPALFIASQRLSSSSSSSSSESPLQPWAQLQQLQKWKGTSSVARIACISEPLPIFRSAAAAEAAAAAAAAGAATEAAAATETIRLAAVGCVGGEVEVLLLQQTAATPCCSLKHAAAVTALKFHPSRALLAVGTADGLLRVYNLSFVAAAATAAAAAGARAAAAPEHVPFLTLTDHVSSITALCFVPAAAAAAAQQQQQHKTEPGSRKSAAAAAAAAATQFGDCLASAAADSLINVWSLKPLPHTAGLPVLQQQQQQQDLPEVLQHIRKSALQLQKRLQQQQQQEQQQQQQRKQRGLLLLQMPTLEIITSLAADTAAAAAATAAPLLLSGGAEGVVKIWDLSKKTVVQVMRTPATAPAASAKTGNEDDPGAFIRTLLLLPANSSSSSSSSRYALLIAQDSGVISVVSPLPDLGSLLSPEAAAAAKGAAAKGAAAKGAAAKAAAAGKQQQQGDSCQASCLLGRLEGLFACRFIPEPPEACCCSLCCCSKRRRKGYTSKYPSRLMVLNGDNCAWVIDLLSGSLAASPLCSSSSSSTLLRFAAPAAAAADALQQQAAVSCVDISRKGERSGSLRLLHSTGRLLAAAEAAHEGCVTAVAFQRKQWSKASPLLRHQQQEQQQQQQQEQQQCLCDCRGISPNSPHTLTFAAADEKNVLRLWRVDIPDSFFAAAPQQQRQQQQQDSGSTAQMSAYSSPGIV
ncbi:WD-40 repeat protein, putative [Eimeria acervulina]|uniref:WD-40 repeat protein, putative n=1 Tax=Eimeria acervulina TaxID=5801 RepID=U6H0A8_EIMAC|nr:WD-40 repeat protein, putative [Eimeria acervulina]CDI84189.1 WD-40 repeat protein, putative [Eimeria acervulina]